MGPRIFEHKEHLVRLVGLFAAGLLVFLALQALLVPKSFGLLGHYRAEALDDNRAHPVAFAGREACEACHSDVVDARRGGRHERVACEACHGAQARHAQADDPAAAKPARPDARLCLSCHEANVARPAAFPQIDTREHAEAGSCFECHLAHRPDAGPEAKP
jgi:hypothetical protein